MPSPVNETVGRLRKRIVLAVLVALAVAVNALENSIPNPLPWVRLGLANAVTLLVLLVYGFAEALGVTVARVLLAALVTGGLLGPSFILSLGGGLASLLAMGLMLPTGLFSAVGISVAGSFVHTLTQFGLLLILLVQDGSVLSMASPFLFLSLPAGAVVGWLVMKSEDAVGGLGMRWE